MCITYFEFASNFKQNRIGNENSSTIKTTLDTWYEINFVNKAGLDSSIFVSFSDNGLKVKTVKVGNVCITEETINGRVLSGRIDNLDGYCGYRYDYQNGENLTNINPNIDINTAISLINKSKREKRT